METAAHNVLELSLMYIPGLLRTEEYMRALFAAGRVRRTAQQLENQVAARLIRQRRLNAEESLAVQRDHRRSGVAGKSAARSSCANDVGIHVRMDGAFSVLSFPHDEFEFPDIMYTTSSTGSPHIEKSETVHEARLLFEQLRSAALSPADSLVLIDRVASHL